MRRLRSGQASVHVANAGAGRPAEPADHCHDQGMRTMSRPGPTVQIQVCVSQLTSPDTPKDVREAAAQHVRDFLQKLAEKVVAKVAPQRRGDTDLTDELVQHTLERTLEGKYAPDRGPYGAWARTVIRNHLISHFRRREHRADDVLLAQVPARPEPLLSMLTLGPTDLQRIAQWHPPMHRLVVLAIAGLHREIPTTDWKQWCQQANVSLPFPPPGADGPGYERGRIDILARHLGCKPNTLHQIWRRKKRWLQDLPSIRRLRDGP
ncbi:MAG: sigma-70 family RNA polymerase sigma factor [Planctomycetota bacterium]|nr:MAG: sigma-70 family RNA polymerase sigma factor [Planctomycetota bacterium]